MAAGQDERQYLSLVATLREINGTKAMLNRENDERNDKATRSNQRKLIFSFISASHAV